MSKVHLYRFENLPLYVRVHLKIITWKFRILNPKNYRVIRPLCLYKSDSHLPKKVFIICFNKSPLKMMKSAFYFILAALFVLKIFKFWSWLWSYWKNGLIEVTFKIYYFTSWLTNNYNTYVIQYLTKQRQPEN